MGDMSRVEQLLRNVLGEDVYEVTPQSRVEVLLQDLNELIEGMGTSVDPTVIEQIVTDWLAENIHDGSAAVVDSSLTIAGAAADAKKTGDEISDLKENLNDKAPVILETTSGAIASFSDGADGMPIKSLVVDIKPVQSGSGDPSPDNVRPISGWTGVTAQRAGKNLWSFDSSYSPSGYQVILYRVPFALKAGTYTFSAVPNIDNDSIVLFGYHADGTRTEIGRLLSSTTRKSETATISKDVVSLYFVSNKAGTISDIQLELGTEATDYQPYQGNTYSVDWTTEAGTVYGGTLDVVSGVLTVDRAMVDLGTLTWTVTGDRFTVATSLVPNPVSRSVWGIDDPIAICSAYKYGNISNGNGVDKAVGFYNGILYARDTTYSTAVDFKSAMSGVQLVYELAEPITYQLTPTEVKSLLGQNYVWADTGDVEVEYRANTKLYIQRLTQPEEDDMIADANIVSGQYFMVGNNLYKATANIASGSEVVVGTNAIRKSLSEALNEINA